MQTENNSTECSSCHKPLTWISQTRRWAEDREVYEFDFRCDSCKRDFRFRDGKLNELKMPRDTAAEHKAMRKAETDAVRSRRCPQCGGPLDDWLACEWCHERYSIDNGELVPRIEDMLHHKPQMREFYAVNEQR